MFLTANKGATVGTGKTIPTKVIVDTALKGCLQVESVVVLKHTAARGEHGSKSPTTILAVPASMTQCRVIGHPYSTKCHCSGRASQCSLPLLRATSSLWSKSTAMVEWLVDVHRARRRRSREAWPLSLNPPVGTRSSPITSSASRTCISSAHLFSCQ